MLRVDSKSVIWSFRPGLEPVCTVAPGEPFIVETRDALDGQVREGMSEVTKSERANPATGPIAVEGVVPGQVLAIDILSIDPADKGYLTFAHRPRFFSQRGGLIPFAPGIRLAAEPMIGTIGVAPDEGDFGTKVPGDHGGNMDTRDVAAGATLYLTARVAGGMIALGDVHSLQGDGETSGQGIETGAEVTLRVRVLPRGLSGRPYLVRRGELMLVVSDATLDSAAGKAVEEMALVIETHSSLSYEEARMLLSLKGDVRVSQIVNPLKTVRTAVPITVVPWTGARGMPAGLL
jgi:amidase